MSDVFTDAGDSDLDGESESESAKVSRVLPQASLVKLACRTRSN